MDKDAILVGIYFDDSLRGFIKKLTPDLYEEAHGQFMMNLMLHVSDDKLISLHESKELKYYCVRMIKNMVTNPRSPFNKKFIKHFSYDVIIGEFDDDKSFTHYMIDEDSNVEDNYLDNEKQSEIQQLLIDVKKWLKHRTKNIEGAYYDEMLFDKKFLNGMTFREIAEQSKICLKTIYTDVGLTQDAILTKFQKRYDRIINK